VRSTPEGSRDHSVGMLLSRASDIDQLIEKMFEKGFIEIRFPEEIAIHIIGVNLKIGNDSSISQHEPSIINGFIEMIGSKNSDTMEVLSLPEGGQSDRDSFSTQAQSEKTVGLMGIEHKGS